MADAQVTTLLDAVNTCLAAIGESPVDNTADADNVDVVLALQFINEVSRAVQALQWGFNSDIDYPMARDIDNKIPVPDNVLRIDTNRKFSKYDVVYRAGYLYDRARRSFTFDENIECDIVWFFPFTELPDTARWYITVAAARKLQARRLGSESREKFANDDQSSAWITLKEAEGDNDDYNMFNASYSVARVLDRYPTDPFEVIYNS